jgi:hypothetical protein
MIAQKSSRTLELDLGWMTAFALLLVATGSIQLGLARAAVTENASSPGSVTNISSEMTDYPRDGVISLAIDRR